MLTAETVGRCFRHGRTGAGTMRSLRLPRAAPKRATQIRGSPRWRGGNSRRRGGSSRRRGGHPALTRLLATNTILFVPTTIHIPAPLLERVDTRAKALGISRNRLIQEALEEKVGARDVWSPEFVQMLANPISAAVGKAFEDSLAVVRSRRSSRKGPPTL